MDAKANNQGYERESVISQILPIMKERARTHKVTACAGRRCSESVLVNRFLPSAMSLSHRRWARIWEISLMLSLSKMRDSASFVRRATLFLAMPRVFQSSLAITRSKIGDVDGISTGKYRVCC